MMANKNTAAVEENNKVMVVDEVKEEHMEEKMEIGGIGGEGDKLPPLMMKSQQRPSPQLKLTATAAEESGGSSIIESTAATVTLIDKLVDENKQQSSEEIIKKEAAEIGQLQAKTTTINSSPMKSQINTAAAGSGGGGGGAHLGTASQQIASMAAAAAAASIVSGAHSSTTAAPTANPTATLPQYQVGQANQLQTTALPSGTRYQQLMVTIDEMSKDIRPTYNGNRACKDRVARSINHARTVVRECQNELEKSRLEKEKAG